MSQITDRAAYLKGLAEGLGVNTDSKEGKLLLALVDAYALVAEKMEQSEEAHKELEEYVEDIDEDLSEMENALFGDEEDEECSCGHHHHLDDEDDEEDDDEDEDDGDDGLIEYDCPNCGTSIYFDETAFDLEEEHLCPNCGKPVFGEVPPEDDDPTDEE